MRNNLKFNEITVSLINKLIIAPFEQIPIAKHIDPQNGELMMIEINNLI